MKVRTRFRPGAVALLLLVPLITGAGEAERRGTNPQDPTKMETRTETNNIPGATKVNEGGTGEPITSPLDILRSTTPKTIETRPVRFSSVKVQQVLSPQFLMIGPDEKQVVVVRLKELHPEIKAGSVIDVSGVVSQLGQDLALWHLDPDKKKLVSDKEVFVNAFEVKSHLPATSGNRGTNAAPQSVDR